MRTYERTHPWLSFKVDLGKASPELWLLLGEAASKCEHIAGVPLKPALHEHFDQLFLAKGAFATTAIEGNTLTEEEVLAHIRGTLEVPPSKQYLAREVDNVLRLLNDIWHDTKGIFLRLSTHSIRDFNRRVLDGLAIEKGVALPGEIRRYSVGVGGYRAAPAEDCEYLLDKLCDWLNGQQFAAPSERQLPTAILKAIVAHLYLAWIHAFHDGNGRTARAVEFQILVHAGVPMVSAHLLGNHYNATRAEYYKQLEQASRSGGDVIPFLIYAVRGFVDGLRSQLDLVRAEQLSAAWRDYVHERFQEKRKPGDLRRLHLVLDLAETSEPVVRSKLPLLSPRVALDYASKTGKTLTRDLNTLRKMDLIQLTKAGYLANRKFMLAFRPMRKDTGNTISES